ncbi:tetratricopeptide repeat protein [Aggregatilinea lenta]|uniref:tetratricopeptide repeat protein n=1 Tax=Aggregatilinea lenta TaxID=913108 RepID=UPI0013C2DAE0|nr:tetratricopeptide repeat protein [Aggregatilinea lenta]
MASQLHEAVRLAQEGHRDDARLMLRQVVQTDPNNEMAWLWLASVAADQVEYERTLNEVLRINPTNQQARTLRDQFVQQYGSRLNATPNQTPPPPTPYTPLQSPPPYGTPTGQPLYGESAYGQPPHSASPQQQPPSYIGTPAAYGALPAQESVVRHERVVERRRRRGCLGCGCVPSCLLVLVIFIVLPAVVCGGIAYANRSANLGPGDWLLTYLPGDLGRKDIEFEVDNRAVSVSVPRSWFLAEVDEQWWSAISDALDQSFPFDDTTQTWADEAVDLAAQSLQNANVPILETNPIRLFQGGAPSGLLFQGLVQAGEANVDSFACSAVQGSESNAIADAVGAQPTFDVIERGQLCGYRMDSVVSLDAAQPILQNADAPTAMHVTQFYIPLDNASASSWSVSVPENQYDLYSDDIDQIIDTATIGAGGTVG